jgi:hypothetical protein
MNCRDSKRTILVLTVLLVGQLFAIAAIPLNAQPAQPGAQRPVAWGYDKAHEIILIGTIEEVNEEPAAGSPVGLHLMVAGSQGEVDAHLGPYMTKETVKALHIGTPVQIVGAMEKRDGKEYMLARQVIFGSRLVQVRNENGLLVRPHTARPHRGTHNSRLEANGGER